MPKVSIITPIYCDTSAKVDWLDEMIQSVVNQTLADWEIILINDKSPLPLGSVQVKYTADNRLRWFENAENNGPAKTRNTAVALAESECILPLDADDMLASNEALEYMYDTWLMDNTKTVYGNVQLLTPVSSTSFKRGKIVQLAEYSFENAMNLGGTMPVSVMHSKECHYQSGGWKAVLDQGREDVEYWIAAGEHGFCGLKINTTTLLYRKHEQSRDYKLKFETKNLRAMQDKIKAMHSDVYAGRFPVACCGKGAPSNPDPVVLSQQNQGGDVKHITTLDGYNEEVLEWVAYRGPKQGSAGRILVRGPVNTPSEYPILGYGHVFQIHKSHRKQFSDRQALGFVMNEPDPRQQPEPEPEPVMQVVAQVKEIPKPEMSTIVRMDGIAAKTREADIQEVPEPVLSFGHDIVTMPERSAAKFNDDLTDLGLSTKLTSTLEENMWTVVRLAETTPQKLSSLPGIGTKRANSIIAKAQELINNT